MKLQRKQIPIIGLILILLCITTSMIPRVKKLTTLYPNMTLFSGPSNRGNDIVDNYTYYSTTDSVEVVINWFEQAGLEGEPGMVFWKSAINLGVIKISRSIIIYQEGNMTVLEVYTSVNTPLHRLFRNRYWACCKGFVWRPAANERRWGSDPAASRYSCAAVAGVLAVPLSVPVIELAGQTAVTIRNISQLFVAANGYGRYRQPFAKIQGNT